MRFLISFALVALTLLCCQVDAVQQKSFAPLPEKIALAKKVFLVNESGTAKLGDELYRQLVRWNRWQVVTDKGNADLILVLNQQETVTGVVSTLSGAATGQTVSGTGVAVPVKTQKWYLHVVDANTGEKLWTADTSMGGKLWRSWGAIAKSLLGDIQKRLK